MSFIGFSFRRKLKAPAEARAVRHGLEAQAATATRSNLTIAFAVIFSALSSSRRFTSVLTSGRMPVTPQQVECSGVEPECRKPVASAISIFVMLLDDGSNDPYEIRTRDLLRDRQAL